LLKVRPKTRKLKPNSTNRIYDLLDCLHKSERKRFPGWLRNELQGRQEDMFCWFEHIEKYKDEYQAWQRLKPDQAFDQAQVNRWNTALVIWIESYLAICAFRVDTFAHHHYLNRAVIRRNPLNAYPSTIRKSRKQLAQQPIRDRTYYQIQHELDRLDLEFSVSYPGVKIRRYEMNQEIARQNEELAILLANVEVAVRRLSAGSPLTQLDRYCVEQLRLYTTPEARRKWPVAYLYCLVFDFLEAKKIISLQEANELINWFKQYFQLLRPDAQYSAAILIHNTLTLSYFRKENPELVSLILEINVWLLTYTEIYGGRYFYRNMIQISIILYRKAETPAQKQQYIQQAYHHLETLKEKLPPEEQEEAYNYNLANLQFELGNIGN
jgi:hypothetical protein